MSDMVLGVGDGSGRLFVHGDYESIKACQGIILECDALRARVKKLEYACAKQNEDVCQTLGAVLGYPWFKDDQKNFPGATEEHGVCVGEHVAETIAAEAAQRIKQLEDVSWTF